MSRDPAASEDFLRIVGVRRTAPAGKPPSQVAREAMTAMAGYRTRVPKGIFFYGSHEEANRDWERWQQATMRANSKVRGG